MVHGAKWLYCSPMYQVIALESARAAMAHRLVKEKLLEPIAAQRQWLELRVKRLVQCYI